MTTSEKYAISRSKERKKPIVLFDAADIALFMFDPTLFPVLEPTAVKGWAHVKSLTLNPLTVDTVDAELVTFVTQEETNYGFAVVKKDGASWELGVFEQAPGAEIVEEVFAGRARRAVSLSSD